MKIFMFANSSAIKPLVFCVALALNIIGCLAIPSENPSSQNMQEQKQAQVHAYIESDEYPIVKNISEPLKNFGKNIFYYLALDNQNFLVVDQNSNLVLFSPNKTQQILDNDVHPFFALSQDKKKVAYTRFVQGRGTGRIYVFEFVNKKKFAISEDQYSEGPIFLPDDSGLIFLSGKTSIASFYRYDFSGPRITQLTNIGIVSGSPLPSHFQPVPSDYQSYRWRDGWLEYRSDEKILRLNPHTGETQWL